MVTFQLAISSDPLQVGDHRTARIGVPIDARFYTRQIAFSAALSGAATAPFFVPAGTQDYRETMKS
jgi:hypothetical protein